MTTVRLAAASGGGPKERTKGALGGDMTTVRLATSNGGGNSTLRTAEALAPQASEDASRPALLVSYAYWKQFAAARSGYAFRDYSLDSGAFTVANSGGTIDLGRYTEFCRERLATDPQCTEVFSLDVIGDWRGSERNTEAMWKAGVPAIPVFHLGEPEALLTSYAAVCPKVALGGLVGMAATAKRKWMEQVFARVWPKKIHGLGVSNEDALMALPFHSVDASSWEQGPAAFGNYKSMAKPVRAPRGQSISLRAEVEWYLALERRVTQRWASAMALLDSLEAPVP
jgi:hypothetical protein